MLFAAAVAHGPMPCPPESKKLANLSLRVGKFLGSAGALLNFRGACKGFRGGLAEPCWASEGGLIRFPRLLLYGSAEALLRFRGKVLKVSRRPIDECLQNVHM